MVPTMFTRLLRLPAEVRDRYDLSSLQTVVHSAAPCPQHVKRQMIDWLGPIVTEYYGGSETGPIVWCTSEEWLAHPGTVGAPADGARVRIVTADDEEAPVGEVGVVYLRPADYWPGFTYHGDDKKRREMELDGFVTVGDMGRVDADGYLYLTDRANDMVISGGVNIYPAEIEAVLYQMPEVRDCAVFGIPDEEYGESLGRTSRSVKGTCSPKKTCGPSSENGWRASRFRSSSYSTTTYRARTPASCSSGGSATGTGRKPTAGSDRAPSWHRPGPARRRCNRG
jgi:long-chain acyl-CoA synthetase